MELGKLLGLNIQRFRIARRWTQERLSAKAGVSLVYVSEIERGKRNPSFEVVARFAKAFGVTLDELVQPLPPDYVPPKNLPRGPNVHHQGRKRTRARD